MLASVVSVCSGSVSNRACTANIIAILQGLSSRDTLWFGQHRGLEGVDICHGD